MQQFPRFRAKDFCESSSFDLVRLLPKIDLDIKVWDATAPSLMPPTLKAVVVLAGAILQAGQKKEPTDWSESFQNNMKEPNLSFGASDEVFDIEALSRLSTVAPLAASRKGETAAAGRDS